ncbi:MAG: hypothetical protein ABR508_11445 [Candidatus Baltobacteraceae bacterium]
MKSANAPLFVMLGALVIWQIVRYAGLRFEAIPGIALGGAMIALGAYRITLMARARR